MHQGGSCASLLLANEQEAKAGPHVLLGRAVGRETYAIEYVIVCSGKSLYPPPTPISTKTTAEAKRSDTKQRCKPGLSLC
jgi:hypothetical protein